jgi:hypothetical protein
VAPRRSRCQSTRARHYDLVVLVENCCPAYRTPVQLCVGAVRAKNSVNIIFNNLAEACMGALIYYLVGCVGPAAWDQQRADTWHHCPLDLDLALPPPSAPPPPEKLFTSATPQALVRFRRRHQPRVHRLWQLRAVPGAAGLARWTKPVGQPLVR